MINDIAAALDEQHLLASLVQDAEKMHVGFVVRMTYESVTVLTNDKWKWRAGGIPQNSFLIATAFDPSKFGNSIPSERIVVLLRARGEAALPGDGDTLKAIIEHYQRKTEIQAPDELDGIEKITHSRLQFSGLECHILGSFYTDRTGMLFMGSDIEDFYSVARLRVYKPTAEALERIVNYIEPRRKDKAKKDAVALLGSLPDPIPIGNVRYTSANPMQRAQQSDVPVSIQPLDFLARRTAVFGMTRTGKSNTVKTTIASVATVAKKAGVKIGQIIFDLKGEYANANGKDDGSSLAEALGSAVIRYRGKQETGFLDLRDNFYKSLESGLRTLQFALESNPANSGQDINALISLNLEEPNPNKFGNEQALTAARNHWKKKVAIYKCILKKAGLESADDDDRITFQIGAGVYKQLHGRVAVGCDQCANDPQRTAHAERLLGNPDQGITLEQGINLFTIIREANKASTLNSSTPNKPWLDESEKGLLNILVGQSDGGTPIRSTRVIGSSVTQYHSPTGSDDVPRDIYQFLEDGKIVIVDLSVGVESTKRSKSRAIANYILGRALANMSKSEEPPLIMMYVEEAHNVIGTDDDLDDAWPRIAKEGAAMNIGLVYCTQEPSSVHPNILANTENFFVTHLNNDREINTISSYYDFKDFAALIKNAQDVGFSRIKTLSSAFVIPTQILEFKPDSVKAAYEAAAARH